MTGSVPLGTADVLLVEDDPADVLLTTDVLADHLDVQLYVVGDGEEAMRFLRRTAPSQVFRGLPWSCSTSTCPAVAAWKCSPSSPRQIGERGWLEPVLAGT